jgi:transketolase
MTVAMVSELPSIRNIDLTCINTIRTPPMDGVQAANSGHPGTPLAMAAVATAAFGRSFFVSIRKT